jgi:hypothetical protein
MVLIVPALGSSPLVTAAPCELQAQRPALPASAPASRWASFAAKILLATAFLVGLASTIAAST